MRRATIGIALVAVVGLMSACADDANDATSTTATPVPTAVPTTTAAPTTTVPGDTAAPITAGPTTLAPSAAFDPATVALAEVATGFETPVDVAWRPGDDTAFVVEQAGRVRPVRDGQVGDPVLDISGTISSGGERGLLGLTFHPTEPLAYVDYTNAIGDTVIAEFAVGDDGTFDPASQRVLLTIAQPYANHNGGNVAIGPDGMLYIGMGDGGSANDPERRALNVNSLLGKILRIDPTPSGDQQYTIPPDNPFVGVPGAQPEIWSVGVRNPWRFAFDSATGDLWIGDVGQNEYEEIDVVRAADGAGRGTNFGWSAFEATHRFNEDQSPDGVTMPVYEYPHDNGACSVSGGNVYRGTAVPQLAGWYLFGDWCTGRLFALPADDPSRGAVDVTSGGSISAVRTAPDGEVFVLDYGAGRLLAVANA